MAKLSKSQKEILAKMQKGSQTIYIGYLGVEGLCKFGMSIGMKIRRGTAATFIREGLAVKESDNVVRLTELGKTIKF